MARRRKEEAAVAGEPAEREQLTGNGDVATTSTAAATVVTAGAGNGQTTTVAKRQSILLKRGDTDLSLDRSGLQRFLPRCMQYAFADHEAEALYREYYENEKRSDFKALVAVLLIVSLALCGLFAASFSTRLLPQLLALLACASLLSAVGLIALRASIRSRSVWMAMPFVMWAVQVCHVLCDLWLYEARPLLPADVSER